MSTVNGDNPFDPFSRDSFQGYPIDVFRSLGGWRPSDFIVDSFDIASICIDWKETSAAHVLKADLPGVKKEEVTVEVWEGRVLRISGERTKEKGDKNDKWHLNERGDGKFLRRVRLPDNAKVDQAKAAMKGGVLSLTIPKEVKEPEGKSIEISG